mmetsp:Transcript_2148/g.7169  ORF Transcript_2148/g.7169 Transcript_2148/m.7169 type:complete len:141 (-) Transcript_2148:104-526(-)
MATASSRSRQGSQGSLGGRPASQGAPPCAGRPRHFASYGAWFQAQRQADEHGLEVRTQVVRHAKPTGFWPYGKDVPLLAGSGNAGDVYKLLGSHDARGFVPRRPPQEAMASSHVLRHAGSATALLGTAPLLGGASEARRV